MPEVMQNYVEHRTEALANVFLTRDPRLVVTKLGLGDFDLLVFIRPAEKDNPKVLAAFNVILWGTPMPIPDEETASRHGNHRWKGKRGKADVCLPVLAVLFSMDDDEGYYAWVSAPRVADNAAEQKAHDGLPRLVRHEKLQFKRITRKSLELIITDVKKWNTALADVVFQR